MPRLLSTLLLIAAGAGLHVGAAAVPDLNGGIWHSVDAPAAIRTSDGRVPPLLPAAQELYDKNQAALRAGDRSFDDSERCLPPGLPRLLFMPGFAFEFMQRPEQILIAYQWNRLLRFVDMNVPQRSLVGPSYLGQSVGHWDHGTLVIDTIGFTDDTVLDSVGLPHSDALHLTERYTPSVDGNHMSVRFTIDDPKTYTGPWQSGTLHLRRARGVKLAEDVCVDRKSIRWGQLKRNS